MYLKRVLAYADLRAFLKKPRRARFQNFCGPRGPYFFSRRPRGWGAARAALKRKGCGGLKPAAPFVLREKGGK